MTSTTEDIKWKVHLCFKVGRYGWVNNDNIHLLSHAQFERYIRHSYHTVLAKLPLNVRKQLSVTV